MCEYSGRLIAWLDRELPDLEAAEVELHVAHCAECREAVSACREVSDAFLACYEAAIVARAKPASSLRAAVVGVAAAAAILAAVFLALPRPEHLPPAPAIPHAPAIAFEKTPARIIAVHVAPAPRPASKPTRAPWIATEPTVRVELPADALFPPGAVPQGFSFIADVRP